MRALSRSMLALLIYAAVLAGCASQPIGSFERPDYRDVAAAPARHELAFRARSAELAPGEQERLNAFLRGLGPSPSDEIMLTFVSGSVPDLDRSRAMAAARAIGASGIPPTPFVRSRAFGRSDQRYDVVLIEVLGRRQIVVHCPQPYADSHFPRIGCANEVNRAAMAARPNELVQPLALSNADAEEAGAATARYRTGEVIAPPPLATGSFVTSD